MKTLLNFLSEPVAVSLGWTLLHALWQGFVLVMPAALLMYFFRHKSSQLRYNLGVGALLAQVLLSVITFICYYQPMLETTPSTAKTTLTTVASAPALWPMVSRSLPWYVQVQHFLDSHLTEIVLCWLIGVAVFLVRLVGGWLYVQRLKTTAFKPADAYWQVSLARLSTRLALRQPVRVMESMQVLVPMVVGALKPVILLPVGLATGLTMREAEAILAHELAHVKRFDYAVNLLQSVIEVVFFFHPALWWLSERVREERENCCDDLAVLACGDARSLAQALARVEEFSQTPVLAMALASRKKLLLNRVRRMLGVSARPVVSNGHLLMLTLATLLLGTASVYAIQEKEQPKPKVTKKQAPPTRRMKTANGTEFGLTDNKKVDYIVWKGQKLPARRVASLQRQLDKVQAGQLSLDDVAQPDRDILLAIIETNQGFGKGMQGLAHIDADNIVVTNSDDVAVNLNELQLANEGLFNADAKLAELQQLNVDVIVNDALTQAKRVKVDYNKIVNEAMASVGSVQPMLAEWREQSRGNQDSLEAVREQNRLKAAQIRLQMEKQRFAAEAVQRKMELVNAEKMRQQQQRLRETMKQRQILTKTRMAQSDSARAAFEKQIAETERAIEQQEAAIEKNSQQLLELQQQLNEAQKPLREAEMELRKLGANGPRSIFLYRPDGEGVEVRDVVIDRPEAPEAPEPPEAMEIHGTYNMGQDHLELHGTVKTPRPPRPPKAPRAVRIPKPASAPKAAIAPVPAVAPKPGVAPIPAIPPKN